MTQSPDVCMNSACAGAADGHRELHTVAVHKNEQHRSRARQGEWRVKTSRPTTKTEKAGGAEPGTVKGRGCLHSGGAGCAGWHRSAQEVALACRNKHTSLQPSATRRNRRAMATLEDKGGGSSCQGQDGVARVSPS